MSRKQEEILDKEIKRMLPLKIIKEGESDYYSPMILVESLGKDPCPWIDYRKLNAVTRIEYYPLPNIEERVEHVSAAKSITVLDLTKRMLANTNDAAGAKASRICYKQFYIFSIENAVRARQFILQIF